MKIAALPSKITTGAHRFKALDGLRGVAAILVVIYHATQLVGLTFLESTQLAVDLFFCLSGFVMTYAYRDSIVYGLSLRAFLARRLVRLYPMLLAGVTLGLIALIGRYLLRPTDYTPASLTAAIVLNALYLPFYHQYSAGAGQDTRPGEIFPTDPPCWSLFFEMLINISFFVVLRTRFRSPAWIGVIAAVAYLSLAMKLSSGYADLGWGSSVYHLIFGLMRTTFGFYTGVLLAGLSNTALNRLPLQNWGAVAGTALFVILCALPHDRLIYFIGLSSVPVIVAYASRVQVRGWMADICHQLGELSYPLYCVHYPVITLIRMLIGKHIDPYLVGVIGCTASTGVAIVLLRLYDEPVRRRLGIRLSGLRSG